MSATKTKISVTISSNLAKLLEIGAKEAEISKSALVESAIQNLINQKMEEDAKKIAKMHIDDLPTEDEWLEIQSDF